MPAGVRAAEAGGVGDAERAAGVAAVDAEVEAGVESAAGAGAGVLAFGGAETGADEAEICCVSRSISLGCAVLPPSHSDEVSAGSADAAGGKMLRVSSRVLRTNNSPA